MPYFRHTYHKSRDYGQPFGTVRPGQVVEHIVNPEPNFFARVDAPVVEHAVDESPVERPHAPPVVERAVSKPRAEKRGLTSDDVFGRKAEKETAEKETAADDSVKDEAPKVDADEG